MLLTERMPQLSSLSHRRAPSAPVVVAATKVPGLLSLSKPPAPQRSSPSKQQAARQRSPKSSKADKQQRSPQLAHAKPNVEAPIEQSSDKSSRGRQQQSSKSLKQHSRNSPNASPAPVRRNGAPQPQSPNTSPAEVSVPSSTGRPRRMPGRAASFQAPPAHSPFLVSIAETETTKATPQISSRPTGKLAGRRRRQAPDSPTPARAVPIARGHIMRHSMSRSVPENINFGGRPPLERNGTVERFPVCDDLSDNEDAAMVLFPTTPVRKTTLVQFEDGPRTAPMFKAGSGTPFGGVFDMSSDEDSSSSPMEELAQLMFGLMPAGTSPGSARRLEAELQAALFASSQFQNAPDACDLPVPAF